MPTSPRSLLLVVSLLASACAGGNVEPRVDTDAGGSDTGTVAPQDTGTPDDASTPVDAATPPVDAPAPVDTPPVGDAGPGRCMGNRDGVIARSEMAFLVGATVTFAINRPGTVVEGVNTAGVPLPDTAGARLWDYSAATPNDTRVLDEVIPPAGQWWASRYPTATYAALLDRATNLLGVYRATDAALELLATVSTEANRTNLAMTPPVTVLQFPLRVGATWRQTVTATGFLNVVPLTNTTDYVSTVDAQGELRTTAGRFPVLRLSTTLDQRLTGTIFRRTARSFTFLSECWGVVGRVASVDDEAAAEFTRASEYRRLGL